MQSKRLAVFRHKGVLCLLSIFMLAHAIAQSTLDLGHGLRVPNARTPWAIDVFEGKQQVVPIHHSTVAVNKHTGANIAGSLAGSLFYKPKLTTELDGASSRNQLHGKTPIFYVFSESDQDPGGESKDSDVSTLAVVRAVVLKGRKVVDHLSYTQLTGNAQRHEDFINTNVTRLADGWMRIEPRAAMEEGEYCLLPLPKTKGSYSTVVYDFGMHESAPNEKDAIVASAP